MLTNLHPTTLLPSLPQGLPEGGLRRIILTASGGAFRDLPVEKLKDVTVAQACSHPNWCARQGQPGITLQRNTAVDVE